MVLCNECSPSNCLQIILTQLLQLKKKIKIKKINWSLVSMQTSAALVWSDILNINIKRVTRGLFIL